MRSVLDLGPPPSLPVDGSDDRFPVRRIFCVGRNYAAHSREMGGDPTREAPFFFMKPADALAQDGDSIAYPPRTRDLHHEVELVVALAGEARHVAPEAAEALIYGYATGVDLTRRDLQAEAKEARRPWEAGKVFEGAAPCGTLRPAAAIGHPTAGAIRLAVNGETRQEGDLDQLIWSVPEILAELSKLFTLRPGDLIYTGTPAGVGPLQPGDRVTAEIEGVGSLAFAIGPAA